MCRHAKFKTFQHIFKLRFCVIDAFTYCTGEVTKRLCTAADLKFYFNHFFESGNVDYLKPNNNCNLTNWGAGCEPGWAASVGPDRDVDLRDSRDMPTRTSDPQPCCEGFFCPRGMTCMIRKFGSCLNTSFFFSSTWMYIEVSLKIILERIVLEI